MENTPHDQQALWRKSGCIFALTDRPAVRREFASVGKGW
jgi:hypothetical protein